MSYISKVLVSLGGLLCCLSFCLTSEIFWWVPCVLLLLGMLLVLCGIKAVCKSKSIPHKETEYIFVTDEEGNEFELIAPITDFDLVYLEAERLRRTGNV